MNVPSLERQVHAADLPLERLAANAQVPEREKIAELSRQFEAVLVRQILHEAQKPVFRSKFTDDSTASGIYQDMTTTQLADNITRSGGLGVAASLNAQLSRQADSTHKPKPLTTEHAQ
jgi:Rod binding domain-containing protein